MRDKTRQAVVERRIKNAIDAKPAIKELLLSLGFTGMANDLESEMEFERIVKYVRVIVKNLDVVTDIDDAANAFKTKNGAYPDTLTTSMAVWKKLRRSPKIIELFKYSQAGVITPEMFLSIFPYLSEINIGDRFKAKFTGRTGTVKETGINTLVKWDEQYGNKIEMISSKTEVEKL